MQIISEMPDIFGRRLITIFAVSVLFFLIYEFVKDVFEKDTVVLLILGAVFLCIAGFMLPIYACTETKSYRLHVDNETTVKELKETYDIIKYDADTDLWIVKEKEKKDE